jgi:peptidylprolyl isomerase
MTTVQNNNTVQVHYTGKLDDGTVFDSSQGRAPLEFTVGTGQVIAGFDNAVRGMSVGQTKTVRIPADEAYGPRHQEAVIKVDRNQFPADFAPEVGQVVGLKNDQGQELRAIIVQVTDSFFVMDANHPLAGFALNFELELVSIR